MEIEDVYSTYRKIQSIYKNKPYRIPKDIKSHIDNKMSKPNRENIVKLTHFFNTKWKDISIDRYFESGFELFGENFSYNNFFSDKIIKYYIQIDKNKKRNIEISKKEIIESFKYIKLLAKEKNYTEKNIVSWYCKLFNSTNYIHGAVEDYLKNKIDKLLITYFIYYKHLKLSEEDRQKIPYIIEKWREHVSSMRDIESLIKKCIIKVES
jgi:hypothetical protein